MKMRTQWEKNTEKKNSNKLQLQTQMKKEKTNGLWLLAYKVESKQSKTSQSSGQEKNRIIEQII